MAEMWGVADIDSVQCLIEIPLMLILGTLLALAYAHSDELIDPMPVTLYLAGIESSQKSKNSATEGSDIGSIVNAGRVPPIMLGMPNWMPLNGREIAEVIANQYLLYDEYYRVSPGLKPQELMWGGCPTVERFQRDGAWELYFCGRAARTYYGNWDVEDFRGGQRLCVEASNFAKSCRFVWRGAGSQQLFLPGPVTPGLMTNGNTVLPYRLREIEPTRG